MVSVQLLAQEAAAPKALDTALQPAALWATAPEAFVEAHKELGFRWMSNAHDAAQSTGGTFLGLPITHSVVRAEGGKLRSATLSLYNRGDDGELTRARFDELIIRSRDAIAAGLGSRPTPRGRDASSAVRADGVFWTTADATYLLEYSFTREDHSRRTPFRAEFVRLEITPKEQPKSLMAEVQAERDKAAPFRGADHVVRDAASGDVRIDGIPMVDQGAKGYCVVASVERVLRYYGVRVDANELAQLADASASEGTSATAMTESLKKLTARFKIRVRTQVDFDYRSFMALVSAYNLQAKRAKAPELEVPDGMIDIRDIYAQMQPDVLRETRNKGKAGVGGFQSKVKASVDKGVPLLWSLMYGLIKESTTNQGLGGHMRLIIGYNEKTQEILYSDSWGLGHELKRMPLADAWAVTTNLASVEPF